MSKSKEYHALKIEHPLLNYFGLTSVTTGELYNWWNVTNLKGQYTNRFFLDANTVGHLVPIQNISDFLLATNPVTDEDGNYTFSSWRKEGYNGKNAKYFGPDLQNGGGTYLGWSYYEGDNVIYDYTDLAITTTCVDTTANYSIPRIPDYPDWISTIIGTHNSVMNAYANFGADYKQWPFSCLKARRILSQDIMSAGGIAWSGTLGFNIQIDNFSCIKYETVKYTLQLFDGLNLRNSENVAGFKKLIISKVAPDQASRRILSRKGGGWNAAKDTDEDIREHTPGELSLTWNPVDKKYESGTIQVPAVLTTDIEAANPRTTDLLESMDIEAMLDNPSSDLYLNMPTGQAILLMNVDGNPTLLAPTYKKQDCEREENDLEKLKVIVYNPFSRTFSKDQNVILNKINGVWIPLDAGQGQKLSKKQLPAKWDNFSYFITNPNHFYMKKDGTRFTYQDFEAAFRSGYYRHIVRTNIDDPSSSPYAFNSTYGGNEWQDDVVPNKWVDLTLFSTSQSSSTSYGINYGHLQITSFDFMSPTIGGMNYTQDDQNGATSIANTHVEFDTSTNPYPKVGSDVRIPAISTAPFFGCVFPDGYNDNKVLNYLNGGHTGTSVAKMSSFSPAMIDQVLSKVTLPINPAVQIFENTQNTNKLSSMFARDSFGNLLDTSLSHLPADIALNASLKGLNGSPLTIYSDSPFFPFKGDSSIYSDKRNPTAWDLNAYVWHFQKDKTIEDSFFDLKPVNPNKIQFRPLKAETFNFAEIKNPTDAQNYFNNANTQYVRNNRGVFGMQARETQTTFKRIMAGFCIDRFNAISPPGPESEFERRLIGDYGIKYNPDFKLSLFTDKPTVHPGYNSNQNGDNFHPLIWDKDWMLSPTRGGGGIGVIGAKYTVSASSAIEFDVESLLGQPGWFLTVRQGGMNNIVIIPSIAMPSFGGVTNSTQDNRYGKTWGRAEFYYDLNTTALFARVFAAWPKEQTYFDPRYFAVLHFNPIDKTSLNTPVKVWYKAGQVRNDITSPPPESEQSYPNGFFQVDKQDTTVDIRIPTNFDGSFFNSKGVFVTQNMIREYKHWNIDPSRRGKLLPYKKTFYSIGVGSMIQDFSTKIVLTPTSVGPNQKFVDFDCIIYNKGQNYNENDTFTVANSKDVVLSPIINNNTIEGFKVINAGKIESCKFFAKSDEKILRTEGTLNSAADLLKIVPLKLTGNGRGLTAYITRGWINEYLIEDKKPEEVTDRPNKLTADPNDPSEVEVTYESSRITEVNVLKTNTDGTIEPYSENDQYDIFFHFHNDISHTLTEISRLGVNGKWGGETAWENAVTVTINGK